MVNKINADGKMQSLMEALRITEEKKASDNVLWKKKGTIRELGVVKHNGKFLIVELKEGKQHFIQGEKNIGKYIKESLLHASNVINLMLKEEDRGAKYILKTPDPAPAPQTEAPVGDMDMDLGGDGLDLGDEGDESTGEPIEGDLEEYQELAGKLAYIAKESSDNPDVIKYILNTIIASLPSGDDFADIYNSAVEKMQGKNEAAPDDSQDMGGDEPTDDTGDTGEDQIGVTESLKNIASKHGYIIEGIYDKNDRRMDRLEEPDQYYFFKDVNDSEPDYFQDDEFDQNQLEEKSNPFL